MYKPILLFLIKTSLSVHILALSAVTASPKAKAAESRWLTEVSLRVVNNRSVLVAEANGHELHLVLDTGATKTALFQSDDNVFSDFTVVGRSEILFPALDEKVGGKKLAPFDIKIGTVTFTPTQPLLVSSRPPIGDRLNFRFDGVLGQDFFHQFVVEIEPDANKLRLYPLTAELADAYKSELKLTFKRQAAHIELYTKMPWEDRRQLKSMLLDTGYPGFMVFWSERHFEAAVGRREANNLRRDNTGIFTRASFRVGKVRFNQAPVFLAPHMPAQATKRDGIIGSNLLVSQKHAIDFNSGRLYLSSRSFEAAHINADFYVPNAENFIYKRFFRKPNSKSIIMKSTVDVN